jgi:hypothetical protein
MPLAGGHGRMPGRVRWPRRIAGVLATLALFGVALAMALMISRQFRSDEAAVVPATPSARSHAAPRSAKAHRRRGPTKAQRRAMAAAVASLRTQGYVPLRTRDYDPAHELRVLVGYRNGDPLGPRRAFFFRGGSYVGTDSTLPSSGLKVARSGDTWVTLSYGVYAAGDRACCPSAGRTKVRFSYTAGAVQPVGGTIPSSTQRVAAR